MQKPVKEMPFVSKNARVVSKKAYIDYKNSIKLPEHKNVFKIKFSVGKDLKEFEVEKSVFDRIFENDCGTLITKNGYFYDFKTR